MMDFTTLPLPGAPLREVDVWAYYDGPRCVLLESTLDPDLFYIINQVEESDDGSTMVWLAAPQRTERVRAIKTDEVAFRDAFTATADATLHVITWRWQETGWVANVVQIPVDEATEAWLPLPEAHMGGTVD